MSMDWFDQNSGGSGNPSVVFGKIGDTIVGELTAEPRAVEVKNDKGERESRLVLELRAKENTTAPKGKASDPQPIAVGDEVTLWVKPGLMASAIRDAVEDAEAKGLSEGDTLVVQFSSTKDTGKIQPAKVYTAKYVPAKPAVSLDSLI